MNTLSPSERGRRAFQSLQAKLQTRDAAIHCGVSESYLNKLRCIGGGPIFIKIGRRVVYSMHDLDEWLDTCRRSSTAASTEAS